jgi:hypothetical protein
MHVRTWVCRVLWLVALTGGMLASAAGAAVAVPEPQLQHGAGWRAGLRRACRRMGCHFGGPCRESAEREPDDPPPIWHSPDYYVSLDVECYLGRYYKIHEVSCERREGRALADDIDTNDRVKPCHAGDF